MHTYEYILVKNYMGPTYVRKEILFKYFEHDLKVQTARMLFLCNMCRKTHTETENFDTLFKDWQYAVYMHYINENI